MRKFLFLSFMLMPAGFMSNTRRTITGRVTDAADLQYKSDSQDNFFIWSDF